MGKAIAADINLSSQGDETNSKNVKFDVYLDEADRNVKEKSADINSGDMKLYVSASVQGGGYLNNAQVELVNTNFKLKNNLEVTKFKLDSIRSEKGVAAGLPIVAKKDESYNLGLLDMQSQIKLTGEYIDDKGNVTDINTTKAVKVSWTSDELTNEDIELNEQVITNKIYNIDGAAKRVVQVLVNSKVKENKAPVKSSVIEIANPEIGVNPEEVKVAGYTTKATNGKTSLDFADGENSSWEYKEEEGKTYINVLNNASKENVVAWAKSAEDKFVVTYIYDEAAVVSPFISNVKNTVDVYGRTKEAVEKTAELKLEELADIGDIAKVESNVTKNIYKGKMYIGEDTSFETILSVYVPYSKIANTITVQDLGDKVLAGEEEVAEGIATYYKTTKINKAEALKILGTEGTIKVYNADDKTAPIKEIVLSEETEEDYYTISYEENVNKIVIEMSAAKEEGTMGIVNEKAIKVSNEDIAKTLTELKTNTNLSVADANGTAIVNSSIESVSKLLEPSTAFNMSLDKKSLSALAENDVRITAELKAKDESNKLYKNPVINIELPREVKEASIVNITPVVGSDELTVKSHNVITNEAGNKVLVVELQGEQTKYSANAANIVIDVKMKTDAFMANKDVEIKSTCINDGETISKVEAIKITSKAGLVTKSTIKVGENVVEKINENNINVNAKGNEEVEVTTRMMNNYGDKLTQNTVIGNVPEGGALKSEVITNMKDAVVYYSEETNPSVDSESWKTEIASLDNVKSFKIVTADDIKQGELVTTNYKYELKAASAGESTIKVSGTVAEEEKEETLKFVTNAEKVQEQEIVQAVGAEQNVNGIDIKLEPKTMIDTIHEGQIITYTLKVTNTSNENLENVTLDYSVPEGAVITELTFGQGTFMEYTDNETERNKKWHIETIAPNKTISKDITIKIKEGAKQIVNNVVLKNSDNSEIANLTTEPMQVIKGDLTVRLARSANMIIQMYEGSEIEYIVMAQNNTDTEMNNVTLKSKVPKQTIWEKDSEYNKDWTYNEETQEITYTIDSLPAGETIEKRFVVVVDKIGDNISKTTIDNSAVVIYNENEYATNVYTSSVLNPIWKIEMESTHPEILNIGDKVKYIIKVTNETEYQYGISVLDQIPNEILVDSIRYFDSIFESGKDFTLTNDVELFGIVSGGKTLTIEIEGTVLDLDDNVTSKQITNIAKINLGDEEYLESNAITNTIVNDNKGNGTTPGDNTDPEEPNEDGKYSISGLAWIDENKDGIRDNNEKPLEAVEVLLLDKDGKEVTKTTTSLTGTYKFDKVAEGEYTVVFAYDTSKYAVTKYQVSGATESTNSDAISKQIEINGETKTVGATDTIKIDGKTINKDIDIGLIENAKFDLSLNKYITKVVLTNSSGTTTYEYEETNFAKVEISARKIAGTTMVIEYELQITNEGDVDSYVGDVIDYLPDGLVFTSETNKDWYMDGNGVLHNKTIAEQVIKPGETKSVTLVLTKSLKSDSTGTIENTGEIGASSNKEGIAEYDSVSGNKKTGEDDMSVASLLVSIATGSPMMYIGIVIGSMVVLGLGIYIINRKVLKERI